MAEKRNFPIEIPIGDDMFIGGLNYKSSKSENIGIITY